MRQKNMKSRCEKRAFEKCKQVCKTYDAVQTAYDKFRKGYEKLINTGGRDYKYLADRHIENRKLRYCPVCAKEERERYGEAYWHRLHQIREMKICPIHHCYLHESQITLSRHCVANIIPAEQEIPDQQKAVFCNNKKMIELAQFYKEAFEAPIHIEYPVPVGTYLSMRLRDEYRYNLSRKYSYGDSGAKNITAIHTDFSEFLTERETDTISAAALQKVYGGKATSFSTICCLAVVEGISVRELVDSAEWTEKLPYKKIYEKVAAELDMDYQTVQKIGDKVLHEFMYEGRVRAKSGMKEMEWEKYDREMLPKVKEACERIYGIGNDRPHRVTLGSIYKEFSLPQKRLDKMPLCKAEILKWKESLLEYWAREVVWAYRISADEQYGTNKTKIQNLTNTKNRDYERYKQFLCKYADSDTVNIIVGLMEGEDHYG